MGLNMQGHKLLLLLFSLEKPFFYNQGLTWHLAHANPAGTVCRDCQWKWALASAPKVLTMSFFFLTLCWKSYKEGVLIDRNRSIYYLRLLLNRSKSDKNKSLLAAVGDVMRDAVVKYQRREFTWLVNSTMMNLHLRRTWSLALRNKLT